MWFYVYLTSVIRILVYTVQGVFLAGHYKMLRPVRSFKPILNFKNPRLYLKKVFFVEFFVNYDLSET